MSERVNKSERTIYRVIKGMPSDFVKDNVKVCVNDNGKCVKVLTENAYKYILQHFDIECQNPSQSDKKCHNSTKEVTICVENVTESADNVTERADNVTKDAQKVTFSNNVEFLLQQLVEKDKQIEYLQQHIQELTELNKNQQVLLQNQQVLFLPEKKKSLFNLFSRRK